MSVLAFVGLPGSGKSYNVVSRVILPALNSGRPIVTNIPLKNLTDFENPDVTFFDIENLKDDEDFFLNINAGAVYIFDEAQLLWPAGLKANMISDCHKKFFSMHRHMVGSNGISTEIVLVTQDLSNIANFFRQLVETTYRSAKLSVVGASKKFKLEVYSGYVTGNKPSRSSLINSFTGSYDPKVYRYYKSNTMASSDVVDVQELRSDGNPSIFQTKKFYLFAILAPLLFIYGVYHTYQFFNGSSSSSSLSSSSSSPSPASPSPSPASPSPSQSPSSPSSSPSSPSNKLAYLISQRLGSLPDDDFHFEFKYLTGYIENGFHSLLFFNYKDYHFDVSASCFRSHCQLIDFPVSLSLNYPSVFYSPPSDTSFPSDTSDSPFFSSSSTSDDQ